MITENLQPQADGRRPSPLGRGDTAPTKGPRVGRGGQAGKGTDWSLQGREFLWAGAGRWRESLARVQPGIKRADELAMHLFPGRAHWTGPALVQNPPL